MSHLPPLDKGTSISSCRIRSRNFARRQPKTEATACAKSRSITGPIQTCAYTFGKEAIASAKEFKKEWLKRHPPESHLVDAIDEHGKSVRKVKNYKDTGSEG